MVVYQCDIKSCAQKIWAQMIPGCGAPYARNSKVEYKEIMKFKFGGAKPVGFIFGGGWEFESVCMIYSVLFWFGDITFMRILTSNTWYNSFLVQLHRLATYKGYTLDDYVQKGKNTSEEQSDELCSLIDDIVLEPKILYVNAKFEKC